MIKKILLISLILLLFCIGAYGKSCERDYDCKSLNKEVTLDQPRCIGQAKTFSNLYGSYFGQKTAGSMVPYLADKQYTKEIQTGYRIKYGCINIKKECKIVAREPIKKQCTHSPNACLITPTEYKGKTWHDICICTPGAARDEKGNVMPLYCGPNGSQYAYYSHRVWTCEIEERIAGICGIGEKCIEKPDEVTCETISGPGPITYPGDDTEYASTGSSVSYTFAIPKSSYGSISIVAKRNGKEIARKSTGMNLEEYVEKNGKITSSKAKQLAKQIGLVNQVQFNSPTVVTASYNYGGSNGGSTQYASTTTNNYSNSTTSWRQKYSTANYYRNYQPNNSYSNYSTYNNSNPTTNHTNNTYSTPKTYNTVYRRTTRSHYTTPYRKNNYYTNNSESNYNPTNTYSNYTNNTSNYSPRTTPTPTPTYKPTTTYNSYTYTTNNSTQTNNSGNSGYTFYRRSW